MRALQYILLASVALFIVTSMAMAEVKNNITGNLDITLKANLAMGNKTSLIYIGKEIECELLVEKGTIKCNLHLDKKVLIKALQDDLYGDI